MPGMDDGTSKELVQRLNGNDQAAWALFVERYRESLLQIVRSSLPAPVRPKVGDEDIVQELFRDLYVQTCRRQLPCESDSELWRILRNRACQRVRHEVRKYLARRRDVRRESPWASMSTNDEQSEARAVDPHADQERLANIHDAFVRFVNRLDLREQVIVHLRLEVGTLEKVADHLACSLRTVEGLWEGICKKAREMARDGWMDETRLRPRDLIGSVQFAQ